MFLLCYWLYVCLCVLLFLMHCFALSWSGRSFKWELVLNWPTLLNKGEINKIENKMCDKGNLAPCLWSGKQHNRIVISAGVGLGRKSGYRGDWTFSDSLSLILFNLFSLFTGSAVESWVALWQTWPFLRCRRWRVTLKIKGIRASKNDRGHI